jgi:hypothetical protein
MTADRRPRPLAVSLVLPVVAVLSLLAAGCSSSSSSTPSGSSSHSGDSSSSSSDSARETAETRLEAIPAQLSKVLADYKSGNKQAAETLAKSTSAKLYEGTTEGIVAKMDPAGERQIDPLLAATIPAAISNGESVSQVTVLIHQGQTLAASCLAAIHKSESSGGG